MSLTLRETDPRAHDIARIDAAITGTVPGVMHASMVVWYRSGRHWAGAADGRTVHEAATALFSLAREEGVE
jgi:hypothetical protein